MGIISKKDLFKLYTFFLCVFTLLLIKLYLNHWLKIPLHYDEAQYWSWSKQLAWGYFSKPPLLAWSISFISNICGSGENCIRALSPVFHFSSACLIFYSTFKITKNINKSFFGATVFLLMPGITFSSLLITTDVPLIFFSTLIGAIIIKLYKEDKKQKFYIYILLSLSLALATLSKYAILYLLFSFILASTSSVKLRQILFRKEIIYTIVLYIILILPNIIWNFNNGFVTYNHTFDNANIKNFSFSFYEPILFSLAQFLIFGIVGLYFILKILTEYKKIDDIQRILLILFLFPILLIFTFAFFSRVNANWAVVGYPYGCILLSITSYSIVNVLGKKFILGGQILVSIILLIFIFQSNFKEYSPFIKINHAKDLSLKLKKIIREKENIAFMADDREDYAHFLYYNRSLDIKTAKWNGDDKIKDHYELTTSADDLKNLDVVFLTRTKPTQAMINRCEKFIELESLKYKVKNKFRVYNIYLLKNWK